MKETLLYILATILIFAGAMWVASTIRTLIYGA